MAKKKKKTKAKPVVDLDEDDELEPVESKTDDPSRPRYDVYFGLTLITTFVLIGAAALLYFDQEDLNSSANAGFNPPSVTAGALGVRPPAAK